MRLIDADALKEYFEVPHTLKCGIQAGMDEYALKRIGEQPTIDAVRVVRCSECKHHEDEEPGMVYCPNIVGSWIEDDFYCAYGERKV